MSILSKAYQDAENKIQDKVDAEIDKFCENKKVVYSAYESDEWDTPIDNLSEIPIEGKVVFMDEKGEFKSGVFESPTWLDIAVIANRMLNETNDYHLYFEQIDIHEEGGVNIATLIMGS